MMELMVTMMTGTLDTLEEELRIRGRLLRLQGGHPAESVHALIPPLSTHCGTIGPSNHFPVSSCASCTERTR